MWVSVLFPCILEPNCTRKKRCIAEKIFCFVLFFILYIYTVLFCFELTEIQLSLEPTSKSEHTWWFLHCGPHASTHITFCFGILWFVELDLMFLSEVGVLSAKLCHQTCETSQHQCCQTYLSYAFSKFLGSPQSSSLHYALLDFAESSCSVVY